MVKTELEPEYYITYNGNNNMGGSTVDDLSPYINGYDVTVLTNSFIRTGYSFLSWNTASDGTGTSYNPSEVISAISADITLYAQWSSVDYTISYNGNGSTGGSTTDSSNPYLYVITSYSIHYTKLYEFVLVILLVVGTEMLPMV